MFVECVEGIIYMYVSYEEIKRLKDFVASILQLHSAGQPQLFFF